MMAKDCTERLPAVVFLVHRPYYSARLMRFGSRGPSEFCSQIRYRNTLTEIAWKDAEKGNIYLSVREKQGIVTGNCCLSAMCFTNSDISVCCFTSRHLTIRQQQRPWKRRWKIDYASFQFFSRLFQGAHLLKRREFRLELKRTDRAQVLKEIVEFIALPFPFPSKLKIWSFHVLVMQELQGNE